MPVLDNINIKPSEMVDILERLRQIGHNDEVTIIDTSNSFTIRDSSGMFLVDVIKKEPEYSSS
jgi:L-fucose mutarotase/ribose pyranase (RbsD/FucU family)